MKNPGNAQANADAKSLQRARAIALNSPDIRVDKVNDIRKEIAEGRFQVDNEAVAGKILQDILINSNLTK